MIDKYCVYIYSLHYVQREYIYHTTNRREEGNRTPPFAVKTAYMCYQALP